MKYLAILLACSLHAAVESEIDEKNPIHVVFSRISHNRIAVENGSVEKIVGDSSTFSVVLDKTTGQAFINVLQDIPKPVTLTVVTSTGSVQDLLITAKDRASERVILREAEDAYEVGVNPEVVQQTAVVEMLSKVIEGKIPFGYGQRAVEKGERLDLPAPLKAETLKAFEGPLDTVFLYQIKNESDQTIVLSSDTLKKEHHSWVFLTDQELKQNQEMICIISQRK